MPKVHSIALFYPAAFTAVERRRLVVKPPVKKAAHDMIEFTEEKGGQVDRELAVHFQPYMDEVRVDAAQLRLQAQSREMEIHSYSVKQINTKDDLGLVLSLNKPGRLRKVSLAYPTFPSSVTSIPTNFKYFKIETHKGVPITKALRLVIRPATPQGNSFTFGPPVMSHPDFDPPGPMFDRVFSGLSVQDTGSGFDLTFPSLMGAAWLIQLAQGDEPSKLAALSFNSTIKRVTIDAAPQNLSLVLLPKEGDAIPLWSHPNYLLPEVGVQEVNFTPIAQNQLAARLKSQTEAMATDATTLPLTLRFHSDSGGAVEVKSKKLDAHYVVKPLRDQPYTLHLKGNWETLTLNAPAGIRPLSSSARLIVRLTGRQLNGTQMPPTRPSRGLRVTAGQWAASPLPFKPLTSDGRSATQTPPKASAQLPLVSARIYLQTMSEAAEAVLEVRRDVAGSPGAMVTAPLVMQMPEGFSDWLEFKLPEPAHLEMGDIPYWLALHSNKGDLLWFTGESGKARISRDKGLTWGEVESSLTPVASPLGQFFHVLTFDKQHPLPLPKVSLRLGSKIITDDLLAHAERKAPDEFVLEGFSFPSPVLDALQQATGKGRVETTLQLFAREVFDLVIEEMTLLYSPSAQK